jgi:hypothetical protein
LSHKIKGVNGININVEDIGTGKPIIFIHGWPVNHKMFEYQFTELPKHGHRCIGIDLRGFGDSDKPWDGYNYDSMSEIGSNVDRHYHIGPGKIGVEGLKTIINDNSLKDLPMVMEMPIDSIRDDSKNLQAVLKHRT